jgi:hypothetical protein
MPLVLLRKAQIGRFAVRANDELGARPDGGAVLDQRTHARDIVAVDDLREMRRETVRVAGAFWGKCRNLSEGKEIGRC